MRAADANYVFLTSAEIIGFLTTLRRDAETLRHYLDDRGAALTEKFAAHLEAFLHAKSSETVSVSDASRATGYSEDHIRRQLSEGDLPNAGVSGRPAIARRELRRKGKKSLAARDRRAYDANSDVRFLQEVRRGE